MCNVKELKTGQGGREVEESRTSQGGGRKELRTSQGERQNPAIALRSIDVSLETILPRFCVSSIIIADQLPGSNQRPPASRTPGGDMCPGECGDLRPVESPCHRAPVQGTTKCHSRSAFTLTLTTLNFS